MTDLEDQQRDDIEVKNVTNGNPAEKDAQSLQTERYGNI